MAFHLLSAMGCLFTLLSYSFLFVVLNYPEPEKHAQGRRPFIGVITSLAAFGSRVAGCCAWLFGPPSGSVSHSGWTAQMRVSMSS